MLLLLHAKMESAKEGEEEEEEDVEDYSFFKQLKVKAHADLVILHTDTCGQTDTSLTQLQATQRVLDHS